MQTSSRRSFMSTAAVAAAASLPGCSAMSPAAASIIKAAPYLPCGGDAELIRLGIEYDRAEAESLALWREWCRCDALWRETVTARGISFKSSEDAVWALHEEVGAAAASNANDAGLDRLDRIRDAIHGIKPTTIAGLAAWAKAARFDATSYFDRAAAPPDRDFKAAAILDFVALIEDMAAQAVRS